MHFLRVIMYKRNWILLNREIIDKRDDVHSHTSLECNTSIVYMPQQIA